MTLGIQAELVVLDRYRLLKIQAYVWTERWSADGTKQTSKLLGLVGDPMSRCLVPVDLAFLPGWQQHYMDRETMAQEMQKSAGKNSSLGLFRGASRHEIVVRVSHDGL